MKRMLVDHYHAFAGLSDQVTRVKLDGAAAPVSPATDESRSGAFFEPDREQARLGHPQ